MPDDFNISKEVVELGKRQAVVEEKGTHIEADVGEIKSDVKCLDRKFSNSKLNSKITSLKVNAWVWFIRISTIAIMSALVTKLFNLW